MTFLLKSEKDKQDELDKSGVADPLLKTDSSGGGVLDSSGGQAQVSQAPKNTGFVGIQQYLKQNQPQSAELAQKVGSGVKTEIDAANKQLGDVGSQFESKVKESEQVFNPDVINKVNTNPTSLSEQEKANVIKQRDAQYTGPKSIEEAGLYQPVQEQVAKAQQKAKYVSSDEGRKNLLKSIQDKRASQGVTNLNNLLIGGSQSAQDVLQGYSQGASDLDTRLKAASEQTQARAKQATVTTAKTAQDIKSGLNTAYGNFKTGMDAKTVQAQKDAQARADLIKQSLQSGKLENDYISDLGLNQAQVNLLSEKLPLIGNDLSRFASFTPAENVVGRNQAATAEDFARQQALLELSGASDSYITPSLTGSGKDLTDFDFQAAKQIAFNKEIQNKSDELEGLYNQILINPMLMNQLGIFSPAAARSYVEGLKTNFANDLTKKYTV